MSITVKAENRTLHDWFAIIRQGKLTLPRFQRREAWGETEIVGLLNSIVSGLPAGAVLTLQVAGEEKFKGRPIESAPPASLPVMEQLLDGQQRLTALWRSLKDNYSDRTFFISFDRGSDGSLALDCPYAFDEARYEKKGLQYPPWGNDPRRCWQDKQAIPVRILDPDRDDETSLWVEQANPDGSKDERWKLENCIRRLREQFKYFNLPFLALPYSTDPKVALDVFVKMNTSFVKLSAFDISVAYMEAVAGESLHDLLADLEKRVPELQRFDCLQDLILDVAALRCDVTPGVSGYKKIDWKIIRDEWPSLVEGVVEMMELLKQERIFDTRRLPSYSPLPVIAAVWRHRGQHDSEGIARGLLKQYLWRAFLTNRYHRSTITSAVRDYRALRLALKGESPPASIPAFNETAHPLPDEAAIATAGWPKEKNILGRALMVLQLQCGSQDFADASLASAANVTSREYHHLFPAATLEDAGLSDDAIWRAVNCALITWSTNRKLSDQDPLVYLRKRTEHALKGEADVRTRLRTHLVPFKALNVGGYADLAEDDRSAKVRDDYAAFCQSRATILAEAARRAAHGESVTADLVMQEYGDAEE